MKKTIRLVIFDLDGTLVNAYRAVADSVNYTMAQLGLAKKSTALIRRKVGWGDTKLIREFAGEELFEKAIRIYRRHHKEALGKGTRLLAGAAGVLKFLKQKDIKTAIATNRPSRFTRIILKELDLSSHFQHILCADKIAHGKPHPMILREVLKKFSLRPSEACYVGDMIIDVQAGRRAGVRTVAVPTGSSTREELLAEGPDHMIERLSELKKLI